MTTNEADDAPATQDPIPDAAEGKAPRAPRRRRASAVDTTTATATEAAVRETAAPDIDEDGAWIEADAVEVHQGAVGRVDAAEVSVTQGAIGAVKGERIDVHMGAVGAALGGQVSVGQGMAGTVLASEVRVEQSIVRTLIARDVSVNKPSLIVFMVAQRVRGEVQVLLDWRWAVAFGAALGVVTSLFGLRRRRR